MSTCISRVPGIRKSDPIDRFDLLSLSPPLSLSLSRAVLRISEMLAVAITAGR